MIYLFAGDDTERKVADYERLTSEMSEGVEVFSFTKNDFNPMQIESLYSGQGLFFSRCSVIFSNVFESKDAKEFLLSKLDILQDSPNDFVFLEGKLTKKDLDEFKKARAKVNYFELPKYKKEKFNNFLLANDFGDKKKFFLWLHFRQAMDKKVGMEELVGVLFWKVKDMILKKDFKNFSKDSLEKFAREISYILPEARRRGQDDEAMFEKFLLEAF